MYGISWSLEIQQEAVQPTLLILPSTAEKYQLPIEVGAVKMDG